MSTAPTNTDTGGEVVAVDRGVILAKVSKQDPDKARAAIRSRMMKASSLDQLFRAQKGTTSDMMEGKSVEVTSVDWSTYESDNGEIPLAQVQYVDLLTGEADEFATTSDGLVTFLAMAQELNEVPFRARIVGRKTRGGNTVLNFEAI